MKVLRHPSGRLLFLAVGANLDDLDLSKLCPDDVQALIRVVRKRGGRVIFPPQPSRTCPAWWRELSLAVAACVNTRMHGDDPETALYCARFNRRWYEEDRGYER